MYTNIKHNIKLTDNLFIYIVTLELRNIIHLTFYVI